MAPSAAGVSFRFLFALLLVLCTYNPSGYSYFHWLHQNLHSLTPYIALAGLALIIGWVIYLKATLNSLGLIGVLLASAFFACLVWLFVYWKILDLHNTSAMAWVVEILLAILLALGMCWSHFSRRLSGQIDVDEIEQN
jgi:hypothetical protein